MIYNQHVTFPHTSDTSLSIPFESIDTIAVPYTIPNATISIFATAILFTIQHSINTATDLSAVFLDPGSPSLLSLI